jgi:hypothetical protein
MFHPPAAIGLALLPMAWAASDPAAHGRSADFPAAAAPLLQKLFQNVLR